MEIKKRFEDYNMGLRTKKSLAIQLHLLIGKGINNYHSSFSISCKPFYLYEEAFGERMDYRDG